MTHEVVKYNESVFKGTRIECIVYVADSGLLQLRGGRGKHKLARGVHIRAIGSVQERQDVDRHQQADASTENSDTETLVQAGAIGDSADTESSPD